MLKLLVALTFLLLVSVTLVQAETTDTIHVLSHDKSFVVTDPTKGFNEYPAIVNFPRDTVDYRKVRLWVTYACPDSLHCGQWDYIDHVFLRRTDDTTGERPDE